jgi:IS1 family transposase
MNKLTTAQRVQVIAALCEGTSTQSVSRMTGIARNTVMKLAVDLGRACHECQDRMLRNLTCKRLLVDEIWSFAYAKAMDVRAAKAAPLDAGDVWTFTAIDADTKLVPSWMIGARDFTTARDFVDDLASRLAGRVQFTTDGMQASLYAIGSVCDDRKTAPAIDYAQLHKIYEANVAGRDRYGSPKCTSIKVKELFGNPDPTHISAGRVEPVNLTMRMNMRPFTRLNNAFSRKVESHAAAIAIHFCHYNFVRIHRTLRVTPAMAAGLCDRAWGIEHVVALLDAQERRASTRVAADSS